MGSVLIDYRGRLPFVERQDQLLTYVERLAQIRTRLDPAPFPITRHAGELRGRIFIDQRLFEQALTHAGGPTVLTREARAWLRNAEVVATVDKPVRYVVVNRVDIHGIEFRLYDWEEFWPEQDGRLSICFLRIPALPHIDGTLVKVLGPNDNRDMPADTFMIRQPTLSLRYDFEAWFDSLFSWIRLFFVRDLHYWHYEPMRRNEAYMQRVRARVPSLEVCPWSRRQAMAAEFDILLRSLSEEALEVASRAPRFPRETLVRW
jgi:hypothetical protein